MSEFRIFRSQDKEWLQTWGTKSNVVEKRLLTKEDGLPISLTLRHIPAQKEVVSAEGYKLHSHAAMEIGYVIRGHNKAYLEGVGEIEVREGDLICNPAGTKHAAVEAMEDTLILVAYFPPYAKAEGPTEEEVAPPDLRSEFRLTRSEEKEWVHSWGTKSNVVEKRYLTKEDGFPIGFLLRHIPPQKEVVSAEGYKLHSHPAIEIGYKIRGRSRGYVEGLGEHESTEGDLICNPAGTKHAAVEAMEDVLIAVINIPPLSKRPTITDKPGGPEES